MARLPIGYAEVRSPVACWIARHECAEEIQRGDADRLLLGRAERRRGAGGGRGALLRMRLGDVEAVGKRAQHGGLVGPMIRSLYPGTRRIRDQLVAADRLDRAGVTTPQVLAVGWRRVLGPLHAHAIITGAVREAQNLYEVARANAPWRRRRIALEKSADLIRKMHDIGFLHADLNVTNILFGRGAGGDRVQIVDLDGGAFYHQIGFRGRFRNLARLLRSYEKWIAGRFRLSAREELIFLRRYCQNDRILLKRFQRALQRHRSRLGLHRVGWLASGASSAERRTDRSGIE
ncbi:MAG: lipopolysaccharide kinase InaA family protein [Acidobacteriota bacterium]